MLKNVTVTLEEEDLRWARHQAAEKATSVSRLLRQMIQRERKRSGEYWKAYERSMERSRRGWPIDAANRLTREEAHERKR